MWLDLPQMTLVTSINAHAYMCYVDEGARLIAAVHLMIQQQTCNSILLEQFLYNKIYIQTGRYFHVESMG